MPINLKKKSQYIRIMMSDAVNTHIILVNIAQDTTFIAKDAVYAVCDRYQSMVAMPAWNSRCNLQL